MIPLIFGILILIGLLIIYPVTPKYLPGQKKFLTTLGLIISHIGIYGLIWDKIHLFLIVSFILIELGLFNLWDPLHIWSDSHIRKVRAVSILLIIAGILCGLSYITRFPHWLWVFPIVFYLAPYFIPPFKAYHKPLVATAIIVTLAYMSIMGFRIYTDFFESEVVEKEEVLEKVEEKGVVVEKQPPPPEPGLLLSAIQDIDQKISSLKKENEKLQSKLDTLDKENKDLNESLKKKIKKIEEQEAKIEELKKLVGQM